MGSFQIPCVYGMITYVLIGSLPHWMCSCAKQLYNPHHCIWVHELHITTILQSKHEVDAH